MDVKNGRGRILLKRGFRGVPLTSKEEVGTYFPMLAKVVTYVSGYPLALLALHKV